MDVQRTQADIRKISLTASIASVVSIWSSQVILVWELIARIEHFVCVHDLRALIQVSNSFLMVTSVDLHDTSVQVVVLFVKDVLLVIVSFLSLLCISFVITLVSALRSIRSSLKLPIKLDDLIWVKITDVLKFILLFLVVRLLYTESEIVPFQLTFFVGSILFFTSTNSSDLVNLGPLCTRYHLRVLVLD